MCHMVESDESEDYRICPYCDRPFKSKGLHAHVMNTDGNGHGKFREVPDDYSLEETEKVDPEMISEIQNPKSDSKLDSGSHFYYCLWCESMFRGERGYKIHLKHSSGDEDHPEDASIEDNHYTLVPTDPAGRPFLSEEEIQEKQVRLFDSSNRIGVGVGFEDSRRSNLTEQEGEYVLPEDAPKPEQVMALIRQEPALYHDPQTACEIVDCSRTTFYEGRNLYDMLKKYQEGDSKDLDF